MEGAAPQPETLQACTVWAACLCIMIGAVTASQLLRSVAAACQYSTGIWGSMLGKICISEAVLGKNWVNLRGLLPNRSFHRTSLGKPRSAGELQR